MDDFVGNTFRQLFEVPADEFRGKSASEYFKTLVDSSELLWQLASSYQDLLNLNSLYLRGKLTSTPYRSKPIGNKTTSLIRFLEVLNRNGFLTVRSAPTMQFRDASTGYITFWYRLDNSSELEDLSYQYNVDLITREQIGDWPFPRCILYNPDDLAVTETEGPRLGLATVSVISNGNYSGINLFEDLTDLSTRLYCNRMKMYNFHRDAPSYRERQESRDRSGKKREEDRRSIGSGIIRNPSVPASPLNNEIKIVRPSPTKTRTVTVPANNTTIF